MKIIKNYIYNMSYQVLLLIVPLITMPYISRTLGPDGLGKFSYTNSIMSYFVLLGSLGITLYGSRQVAYVQSNKNKRSEIFWEVSLLKILTFSFSTVLLIVFLMIFSEYRVLILAQGLTLLSVGFDVSWYFIGIEDFKKTVIRNISVKLVSLVLIFTMVHTPSDLLVYIIILGGSTLIGNIVLMPFLFKQINAPKIKKINILQHLGPVILLFLPQVATQIYLVVNKTMLGEMDSIKSVGFFSSSDTLVRLALTIVSSVSAVLMPRIANLIAQNDGSSVEKYMKKSFEFINFLSLPIMFGLAAIAPKFIPLFLGEKFKIVSHLVILESPVILLISWSIAITNQYLIPAKMNKEYTISTVIGAVANILMNILLINIWGVYGAIIATLLSETLVIIYLIYSIRHIFSIRSMIFSNFWKYIFSALLMLIFVLYIDNLLSSSVYAVMLEICLGLLVYLGILMCLKTKILVNWRSFFDE